MGMSKLRTAGIGAAVAGLGAYLARRFRKENVDDVTLTHKVESELFRAEDAPKDRISVNTADGVVQLRGEVDSPELIETLVNRARSVQGVKDVENLLHTPGTEAPMHQ
jgi:osmotically-inducible protein OsmY